MITWFGSKKTTEAALLSKEKDDFVSLSSHELRTPLSVIKWYTEMLLDEDAGPLTEDQRKYLTTIQTSNQKAIDLVRSLLNVSRLDLGTFSIVPSPLSLSGVVDEVVCEMEKRMQEKNITITKKYSPSVTEIVSDKKMCLVALRNLIHNAISYSNDSGNILITISGSGDSIEGHDQPLLEGSVLIAITDSGIGIPENDKEKIFSKMFKGSNVKDRDTGSGLGLYITKTILENIGGKIWFTSKEGAGSTFYMVLPKAGLTERVGKTNLD